MADNRFIKVACTILGIKTPSDIKKEELVKLLKEHFGDANSKNYFESEAGIIYRNVFDEEMDD